MASPAQEAALPHQPIFAKHPGSTVIEAFKAHIRSTGSPETFDRISMTLPPTEGDVVVLDEFSIDINLRRPREMAPCPICSHGKPKYIHGVLIWCVASKAIYAIGPDCAAEIWEVGRLDRALRKFREEKSLADQEETLLKQLPLVPALRRWIGDHLELGRQVDNLRQAFNKAAPALRQALSSYSKQYEGDLYVRDLYQGGTARSVGKLQGRGFLNDRYDIERCLSDQDSALAKVDAGADLGVCIDIVDAMDAPARRSASRIIREAVREISRQAERVDAAVAFLSPSHIAVLAKWAEQGGLGTRAGFASDGRVVRMEGRDQVWLGVIEGLRKPSPLPL